MIMTNIGYFKFCGVMGGGVIYADHRQKIMWVLEAKSLR